MRQSGFEPKAVALKLFCSHRLLSYLATSEPHETTIDNDILIILYSPLIFSHDNTKLIIDINIEIDIGNPKE